MCRHDSTYTLYLSTEKYITFFLIDHASQICFFKAMLHVFCSMREEGDPEALQSHGMHPKPLDHQDNQLFDTWEKMCFYTACVMDIRWPCYSKICVVVFKMKF